MSLQVNFKSSAIFPSAQVAQTPTVETRFPEQVSHVDLFSDGAVPGGHIPQLVCSTFALSPEAVQATQAAPSGLTAPVGHSTQSTNAEELVSMAAG
jgi:hypothetical protein